MEEWAHEDKAHGVSPIALGLLLPAYQEHEACIPSLFFPTSLEVNINSVPMSHPRTQQCKQLQESRCSMDVRQKHSGLEFWLLHKRLTAMGPGT